MVFSSGVWVGWRSQSPLRLDGFTTDASVGGLVLEPGHGPVVRILDRPEHIPGDVGVAEQGEYAEGLLGCEREVEPDSHRRRPPSFQELGEVLTGHEPLTLRATTGDEVRLAGPAPCVDGLLDLAVVVLVVLGEFPHVLLGYSGEACRFADRELVVVGAACSNLVGIDARFSRRLAGDELDVGHPPGTIGLDNRHEIRGPDLPRR